MARKKRRRHKEHGWKTHVDRGALEWLYESGYRTLLDVGCGPGGQVNMAREVGFEALGVDYDRDIVSPFIVHFDLTKSHLVLPSPMSVVWSVEVGEHIDPMCEQFFLHTITNNCAKVIVLSCSNNESNKWHVNCHPREYWIEKVEQLGFKYDIELLAQMLKRSTMKREFLRENGMLFTRVTDE